MFLYSLWSVFTLCTKEYTNQCCVPSVSMSHAGICTQVVKHRLDELWEIVIVLPAPVPPCIGVIKVHWPTVSWKETRDTKFILTNYRSVFVKHNFPLANENYKSSENTPSLMHSAAALLGLV